MRSLPTGTVSFLFTDIQGSTELLHKLGDQPYGEVLLEHQRLLRHAFAEHEGAEVDTQGDAFFVAFPRSWNAVAAAAAAQQALTSHPWPEGVQVRVRMGIHTGEPTLAGDHYVGLDVHRAARIAATGYGQQVLLSERAYAMAREKFPPAVEVRDLGEHRLKDIHRPEHIFQLIIPGVPADFPPLKSLEILITNVPALQLTSFVGREREMAEIKARLAASRLVTLLGPGGTGKTRLALQVGGDLLEHFPKGVWLVELASLADPGLVIQTVATVFNVREAPGRPLLDSLNDYLKPRELLLILDNCEHLIEASAHLAHALLRACPQLRILATSREPLGGTGEAIYRVPPLSRPDPARRISAEQLAEFEAARLFVERATLSNPRFSVTDTNAPVVARLVSRLDGIPLAIELAAARTKVLPVEQIAQRLDDRFRLLSGGVRTDLPHHQTLRAAIDWSHDLLSEPERTLFRRLSVFAGGFSLEAAEWICPGGEITDLDVLDLLARLVDKSLVITEELEGDVRYRMLETIRHYSREKLAASGEEAGVRGRHLQWHLTLAEQAEPPLRGPDQVVWLDRLELDHDDLRAALEWAASPKVEAEVALRLGGALHRFWLMRGFLSEGRAWLEEVLKKADVGHPATVQARLGAGVLAHRQGDHDRAEYLLQASLTLSRSLGDDLGAVLALNSLGRLTRHRGDLERAAALVEESAALSRTSGLTWPLAEALNVLGLTTRDRSDYARARVFLEEALSLWRNLGDKWGLAEALNTLGVISYLQGDYDRARVLLEESLALRREMGDRLDQAVSLVSLGSVAEAQRDYERATKLFEESIGLSRELGHKANWAASLTNLGITAYWQGEYQKALSRLEEARAMAVEMGSRARIATCLNFMGMATYALGQYEQSGGFYRQSLAIYRGLGEKAGISECLAGLARVVAARGDHAGGARLFGASERLREVLGYVLPPADREHLEASVAALKGETIEEAFADAWEQGRMMTLEEAIAEALREEPKSVPTLPQKESPPG